jgi:hypothetical protein
MCIPAAEYLLILPLWRIGTELKGSLWLDRHSSRHGAQLV